jgi:hypothetical protein
MWKSLGIGYIGIAMASTHAIINPQSIPVTNPDNVRAVYSNHFGMSATATDFSIFFLEVGQIPGPDGPIQKHEVKAVVTLPMIAAVGLQEVLKQLVAQTEESHAQAMHLIAAAQKASGSGKK